MNIFRNRLGQSSGSQTGTTVYIDGIKSRASRVDLEDVIPMPYDPPITHPSAQEPISVVYQNEIHLLGGYGHEREHIKWNGSEWISASTLSVDIDSSAVSDNNYIYALGEESGFSYVYTWDGTQWSKLSEYKFSPNVCCLIIFNNEVHVLSKTVLYKYNGTGMVNLASLPYTRTNSTITVYNGAIHLLGGDSQPTSHYKWDGSSWINASTIPANCTKGCSLVYNNKLHLFFNDSKDNPYHYVWDGIAWNEDMKPLCAHGTQGLVFKEKIMLLGHCYSSFIEPLNSIKDITIIV